MWDNNLTGLQFPIDFLSLFVNIGVMTVFPPLLALFLLSARCRGTPSRILMSLITASSCWGFAVVHLPDVRLWGWYLLRYPLCILGTGFHSAPCISHGFSLCWWWCSILLFEYCYQSLASDSAVGGFERKKGPLLLCLASVIVMVVAHLWFSQRILK